MKKITIIVFSLIMLLPIVSKAEDAVEIYKEKWAEVFLAQVKQKKTLETSLKAMGKSQDEIEKILVRLGSAAAECQIKAFKFYKKRYIDVLYSVVKKGGGIRAAGDQMARLLFKDIKKGKISKSEATKMHTQTTTDLKACIMRTTITLIK